jgi:hypothetical protein
MPGFRFSISQPQENVLSFYLAERNISGDDGSRRGSRNQNRHANGGSRGEEHLRQRSEREAKGS